MKKIFTTVFITLLAAVAARGEWLDKAAIGTAARAFPDKNAIGASVLHGRSLASVTARGALWIARYEPSGYAVFSGSDLVGPVIAFSDKDYVEPGEGEAFFTVLAGASEGCRNAEETGETEDGLRRRSKWRKLLDDTPARPRAAAIDPEEHVTVEPFLQTHWHQAQPYNDFAPIYNHEIQKYTERGRTPCGCVATAAAQVFNYWRWPARIDSVLSFDHVFSSDIVASDSYSVRFDGHLPIDWNSLTNSYPDRGPYSGDMRGYVEESVRHPIARLIHFCDVLAQMQFGQKGSGANFETLIGNAPWYSGGERRFVNLEGTSDKERKASIAAAKADIIARRPVMVTIPGHAAVGHGWSEDGDEKFIYLNYGWGGDSDNYYNLDDSSSESSVLYLFTGFMPRPNAQLDPIPAVVGESVQLQWHVPDCWADSIKGCSIVAYTPDMSGLTTATDDFSSEKGKTSSEKIMLDDGALGILPLANGTYTWNDSFILSEDSVLSYNISSVYAYGHVVTVEASFDNGPWTVLSTPELALHSEQADWAPVDVFLGDHGGEIARFRVRCAFDWSGSYPANFPIVSIDNVQVSEAYAVQEVFSQKLEADSRSGDLSGLESGNRYLFAVRLTTDSGTFESDPVSAYCVEAPAEMPRISSVTHSKSTVQEGLFAECSMTGNVFTVTCSPSVVSLEAHVSAASFVPDSAIKVHSRGNGKFVVEVDGGGIPDWAERTRAILTLAATDASGTTVYRDFSLRFSTETEGDAYAATIVSVGGKGVVEETAGAYVVTANDGQTLSASDFSFGEMPKEAYDVSIAAGGKSATVTLKSPTVGAGAVEIEAERDPDDPSGMLVSIDPEQIAAAPDPADDETVGAMPVRTYPGLYYQAGWGPSLGKFSYGAKVPGTGGTLYLGVIKQNGSAGFYKIIVSESAE